MPEQHLGKDVHHSRTCRYPPGPSATPGPRVRNLHRWVYGTKGPTDRSIALESLFSYSQCCRLHKQ